MLSKKLLKNKKGLVFNVHNKKRGEREVISVGGLDE